MYRCLQLLILYIAIPSISTSSLIFEPETKPSDKPLVSQAKEVETIETLLASISKNKKSYRGCQESIYTYGLNPESTCLPEFKKRIERNYADLLKHTESELKTYSDKIAKVINEYPTNLNENENIIKELCTIEQSTTSLIHELIEFKKTYITTEYEALQNGEELHDTEDGTYTKTLPWCKKRICDIYMLLGQKTKTDLKQHEATLLKTLKMQPTDLSEDEKILKKLLDQSEHEKSDEEQDETALSSSGCSSWQSPAPSRKPIAIQHHPVTAHSQSDSVLNSPLQNSPSTRLRQVYNLLSQLSEEERTIVKGNII